MEFNATFLATIVTFIVFVILMNKILYAPILSIMAERRAFIDGNYKSAKDNDERTSELTKEKNDRLIEAKNEAREKYNETLAEFKERRSEMITVAQNESKEEFESSKIQLENVSNEVKQALKGSMMDLANDIVEKVIGYRSEINGFDEEAVNKVLWEK